jgi:hypothetical protein
MRVADDGKVQIKRPATEKQISDRAADQKYLTAPCRGKNFPLPRQIESRGVGRHCLVSIDGRGAKLAAGIFSKRRHSLGHARRGVVGGAPKEHYTAKRAAASITAGRESFAARERPQKNFAAANKKAGSFQRLPKND